MSSFSYAKGFYAFDWDSEPHLNHRALDSPVPCRAGYNCTYSGVCSFVHPGEEGIGRRIFPARAPGEKDIVRLFGVPEKKATFYERRRLRLSWPAWCERVGWQMPVAPQPVICAPAPALGAGVKTPSHRRKEKIQLETQPPLPAGPPPTQAPLPFGQPMFFFPSPEALKKYLGEFLYKEVEVRLAEPEAQEMMVTLGWAGSPGKITGMILAGLEIPEILELFTNAVLLNDYIMEAFETLKKADPLGCALGITA